MSNAGANHVRNSPTKIHAFNHNVTIASKRPNDMIIAYVIMHPSVLPQSQLHSPQSNQPVSKSIASGPTIFGLRPTCTGPTLIP